MKIILLFEPEPINNFLLGTYNILPAQGYYTQVSLSFN